MERRIAPSAALEEEIARLLSNGVAGGEGLAEVGRLGGRLVLQPSIDEAVEAFLRRARPRGC